MFNALLSHQAALDIGDKLGERALQLDYLEFENCHHLLPFLNASKKLGELLESCLSFKFSYLK